MILNKVMWLCRGKGSSPSLPYIPLSFTSISANLSSILYLALPYLPYLPLTFPFYFPSLYSYFPLNLPRPYFSSSLNISFPTYPLQSLTSPYLPFPHPSPYPFISPFPSLPLLWDLWFLSPSGGGGIYTPVVILAVYPHLVENDDFINFSYKSRPTHFKNLKTKWRKFPRFPRVP